MEPKSLAEKFKIKSGRSIRVVNPPEGYASVLEPLPPGVAVVEDGETPADVVLGFVTSRHELEEQLAGLKAAMKPGGALWLCWPKGGSRIQTDINRDSLAAYVRAQGLDPVANVAVDADWSALRFKQTGAAQQ